MTQDLSTNQATVVKPDFTTMKDEDILRAILSKFNEFRSNKKTKTFYQIMSQTLSISWAGSKGIYKKFGVPQSKWWGRQACNIYSDNNLIKVTNKELTIKFAEAIHGDFKVDKKMGSDVKSIVADWLNKNGTETIREQIKTEAAKLAPVYVQINKAEPVKIEGRMHKDFEEVLEGIVIEKQAFLAGPAGTGKTTLAEQIAKALKLRFSHISCTAGMSEAHLLGRMTANGEYMSTDFVDFYENGGVFLFDEVDAADSNTMLVINSALANGSLSVPNRSDKRTAKRHKDFYCICAANTWGYGSSDYAGRNVLDQAFLDRFTGSRYLIQYDTKLEEDIAGEFRNLAQAIWKIRENVMNNKIRRVVSTRAVISGVRRLSSGKSLKYFIQERLMQGWTVEEKAKALSNVNLN